MPFAKCSVVLHKNSQLLGCFLLVVDLLVGLGCDDSDTPSYMLQKYGE
jgi:hypothetical protein